MMFPIDYFTAPVMQCFETFFFFVNEYARNIAVVAGSNFTYSLFGITDRRYKNLPNY